MDGDKKKSYATSNRMGYVPDNMKKNDRKYNAVIFMADYLGAK